MGVALFAGMVALNLLASIQSRGGMAALFLTRPGDLEARNAAGQRTSRSMSLALPLAVLFAFPRFTMVERRGSFS